MAVMAANARGAAFALAAFAVFSSHDVVIKSLGDRYSVAQLVFFSVLLGTPLMVGLLVADASGGSLRPKYVKWAVVRAISAPVAGVCVFYAFTALPLAQTYAILFSMPLLITVLAIPLLGETVRLRRWAAVLVGLIGVLIVLRPDEAQLGLGHAAALIGAGAGALNAVIVRKIGREERTAVLLLYPMAGNFLATACALPFVYQPMPFGDFVAIALASALAFCAGQLTIAAYRTGEAAIVAPMQYSQILWATLYGYALFGDALDANTLIGAGVVIASGIYIIAREARSGASNHTPVLRTKSRVATPSLARFSALLDRRPAGETPKRE